MSPSNLSEDTGKKMSISSEEEMLVQMVHDFMESDAVAISAIQTTVQDFSIHHQKNLHLLEEILGDVTDTEMLILQKADKHFRDMEEDRRIKMNKRLMMKRLRIDGYDASLCVSSWAPTINYPGGDYEYVDIVVSDSGAMTRLIVDIDFRRQFELSRPTPEYRQLYDTMPPVFVGTEEKLKKVVSFLCSAVQQSLRERGVHVPPWRTSSYMQMKWLSSYHRWPSDVSSTSSPPQNLMKLDFGMYGGHNKNRGTCNESRSKVILKSALASQLSHFGINCY